MRPAAPCATTQCWAPIASHRLCDLHAETRGHAGQEEGHAEEEACPDGRRSRTAVREISGPAE